MAGIVKDPAFALTVKLPLVTETSLGGAVTVQYKVVPSATLVVLTLAVALDPSLVETLDTL